MVANFIEGPLWTISVILFVVGVCYRLFSMLRLGIKPDLAPARDTVKAGGVRTIFSRFIPRHELMARELLIWIAGYIFHIALFALVFFAEPHVRFIETRILGFGWAVMPNWAFMLASSLALGTMVLLWMRRLLEPVRKVISTADDHISSILIIVVILTGFMAIQKSYDLPRVIHLLSVELLLIYFPFSRLMHAFTFVFSRYYTGAQYARRGVKA